MLEKKSNNGENEWDYVVIAMIAINQFSLEKACGLFDKLDANGLFNLQNLASWKHEQIFNKLKESGYNKADYVVGLLTERLMSLGALAENIQVNEKILKNGSNQEVGDLLLTVNGIGPAVLKNYFSLRGKL